MIRVWLSEEAWLATPAFFARCLVTASWPLWYANPLKAAKPEPTAVMRAIPVGSNGTATAAATNVAAEAEVFRPEWLASAGTLLLERGGGGRFLLLEGMVKNSRDSEKCK